MTPTQFLTLDATSMWKLAAENLKSGKWDWKTYNTAVNAWREERRKEEQQLEAEQMQVIRESFGG